MLGHACELPALAELVSDPTEGAHHPADHHADESLISCDAVGVPSSPGHLKVGAALDVVEVLPVARPVVVRLPISSLDGSKSLPSHAPLFLLHASLLI